MKIPVDVFDIDASEKITQLYLGYIDRHTDLVVKIFDNRAWNESLDTRHDVLCIVHAEFRSSLQLTSRCVNRLAHRFLTLEELHRYKIKPILIHYCLAEAMCNPDHRVFDRLCDDAGKEQMQSFQMTETSALRCNLRCMARLRKELGLPSIQPSISDLFDNVYTNVAHDTVRDTIRETLLKLLLLKAVSVDELKEIAWFDFLQAQVTTIDQHRVRLLESLHTVLPRVLVDLVLEYFV